MSRQLNFCASTVNFEPNVHIQLVFFFSGLGTPNSLF